MCAALVGALPGRVWEGKVYLLKAVKTVFTACKEEVKKGGPDTPVSVAMASILYLCELMLQNLCLIMFGSPQLAVFM